MPITNADVAIFASQRAVDDSTLTATAPAILNTLAVLAAGSV